MERIDYNNIKSECERIKQRIELAESEGDRLLAFRLKQELEFLMRNFPEDCNNDSSEDIDEPDKEDSRA